MNTQLLLLPQAMFIGQQKAMGLPQPICVTPSQASGSFGLSQVPPAVHAVPDGQQPPAHPVSPAAHAEVCCITHCWVPLHAVPGAQHSGPHGVAPLPQATVFIVHTPVGSQV